MSQAKPRNDGVLHDDDVPADVERTTALRQAAVQRKSLRGAPPHYSHDQHPWRQVIEAELPLPSTAIAPASPADARLIAAGPAMLAALQAIAALDDGDDPGLWPYADELSAARKAIEEATGVSAGPPTGEWVRL